MTAAVDPFLGYAPSVNQPARDGDSPITPSDSTPLRKVTRRIRIATGGGNVTVALVDKPGDTPTARAHLISNCQDGETHDVAADYILATGTDDGQVIEVFY